MGVLSCIKDEAKGKVKEVREGDVGGGGCVCTWWAGPCTRSIPNCNAMAFRPPAARHASHATHATPLAVTSEVIASAHEVFNVVDAGEVAVKDIEEFGVENGQGHACRGGGGGGG